VRALLANATGHSVGRGGGPAVPGAPPTTQGHLSFAEHLPQPDVRWPAQTATS